MKLTDFYVIHHCESPDFQVIFSFKTVNGITLLYVEMVQHGVAFHHGGMNMNDRGLIESKFLDSTLNVISIHLHTLYI